MWITMKILGTIGFLISAIALLQQTNHDITSYISYLLTMIFYTIFLFGLFGKEIFYNRVK